MENIENNALAFEQISDFSEQLFTDSRSNNSLIYEKIDHDIPDLLETEIETTQHNSLEDNLIFPDNSFKNQTTPTFQSSEDLLLNSKQIVDPLTGSQIEPSEESSTTTSINTLQPPIGDISAINGSVTGNFSRENYDPTSYAYLDDYQLTDITNGEVISLDLKINPTDFYAYGYLNLVNADTGENIKSSYFDPYTKSSIEFVANSNINYLVRIGSYNPEETITYQLNATSTTRNLADLTITDNSVPAEITLGQTTEVTWTVSNLGNANTTADYWYDEIYLSRNNTFEPEKDAYLTSIYNHNSLEVNSNFTNGTNINIQNYHYLNIGDGSLKGDWHLLYVTDAYDKQLEKDETNNVIAHKIQINAPDITITNTEAPSAAVVGEKVDISWTVKNQGNVPALGYWEDRVYLSDDEYLDESDTYVYSKGRQDDSVPLEAGDNYLMSSKVTIPDTVTGSYYLLFTTDKSSYDSGFGNLGETDETNNVIAHKIQINAPDITITNAQAPTAAVVSEKVDISWTVKNQGNVPALGYWEDRVYLSDDEYLDESDTYVYVNGRQDYNWDDDDIAPLEAGDNYLMSSKITIPDTVPGSYYLLFVTDKSYYYYDIDQYYDVNNLGETDETNNVIAHKIQINAPDITITNAQAPTAAVVSEEIDISWTVKNQGKVPAFGYWADEIYLSEDEDLDYNDISLYSKGRQDYDWDDDNIAPLEAGDNYLMSSKASIPDTVPGSYYLLFVTDTEQYGDYYYFDNLGETDETNNLTAIPLEIVPPNMDLLVNDITVADTTNPDSILPLEWTVQNIGKTATTTDFWYDRIYLSKDKRIDRSDRVYTSYHQNFDNSLEFQESYTTNFDLHIPKVEPGEYFLIVATDQENRQIEDSEENNTDLVPITVTQSPNLTIADLSLPTDVLKSV
jgi:subtilase family serine protease